MSNDTHEHCWKLLPWFVTGRVSANDMQRIERHLEECAACRVELAEQRELCMHIRRDEPLMLAPQASLQKMMARIDAEIPNVTHLDDEPVPAASGIVVSSKSPPRSYRWLAIAAAVQTIAIGFLLTLVWQQTADVMTAPRFTTLSNPNLVRSEGAVLRVVFKPETRADQMQSLLRSVDAQVIAGPTEAGVYTLRLAPERDEAPVARALSQVRADRSVIFAEHISVERKP